MLVGGGDPLLASRSLTVAEAESTYPARADVTTLALQVAEALGGQGRVRVRFDDSLFTGPTDNPAWRRDYVPDDIVSPITALMVDGGDEPDSDLKSDEPSLAAAQVFADGLRAAGLRVDGQPQRVVAPAGAEELASVESAPLSQVAERILDVSDNEGAEVVGHQVGLATSGTGSFEAGAAGVLDTLGGLGIDVAGAEVYDGSGLSRRNRVSTSLLIDLIQHAAGPDGEGMRSLVTGMPVAGFTGSLTYRFAEGPAVARGLVRAKTGTLTGVHALAGIAVDRDGQPLAFVFGADKSPPIERYDSQEALDRAAASLASCRCSARRPRGGRVGREPRRSPDIRGSRRDRGRSGHQVPRISHDLRRGRRRLGRGAPTSFPTPGLIRRSRLGSPYEPRGLGLRRHRGNPGGRAGAGRVARRGGRRRRRAPRGRDPLDPAGP